MNPTTSLQASMWLMIAIQTMSGIDLPGHGPRKMPAPKVFVAIVVLWSIFGIMADAGMGKVVQAMSWVTVLTALVIGPAGTTLNNFLKAIAQNFGTALPPGQGTSA